MTTAIKPLAEILRLCEPEPDVSPWFFGSSLSEAFGKYNYWRTTEGWKKLQSEPEKHNWRAVLELPEGNVSERRVKDQYRKLAMLHHPDRPGGNTEKKAAINTAFEQACAVLDIT
jgi:hypothetical protein